MFNVDGMRVGAVFDDIRRTLDSALTCDTRFIIGGNMRLRTIDNGYELDLPGIGKENIEIVDENDTVEIKWTDKRGDTERKDNIVLSTPSHSETTADYKNKVLTIKLAGTNPKGKKVKIT